MKKILSASIVTAMVLYILMFNVNAGIEIIKKPEGRIFCLQTQEKTYAENDLIVFSNKHDSIETKNPICDYIINSNQECCFKVIGFKAKERIRFEHKIVHTTIKHIVQLPRCSLDGKNF